MKMTSLLLGKEFLLSRRLGSDATCEDCEPAEWPGKTLIKRSSGREPVLSTPLSDSTPDKVLRDIGEDTITLQWKKKILLLIKKNILKTNWQSWLIWIRRLVLQQFPSRNEVALHAWASNVSFVQRRLAYDIDKVRNPFKNKKKKKQREGEDCTE